MQKLEKVQKKFKKSLKKKPAKGNVKACRGVSLVTDSTGRGFLARRYQVGGAYCGNRNEKA